MIISSSITDLMIMNFWVKDLPKIDDKRNGEEVDGMDFREMLRALPKSYDDFVNSTAECMEQEEDVRIAVLEQLQRNPDSTPSDVLKVMCECLGMVRDEAYSAAVGIRAVY